VTQTRRFCVQLDVFNLLCRGQQDLLKRRYNHAKHYGGTHKTVTFKNGIEHTKFLCAPPVRIETCSRSALFSDITQRRVITVHRRFGTTYWSHLQGLLLGLLDSWKMGPIGCPETSVQSYHSALRNIPKERSSHLHGGRSLKSRNLRGFGD
jgi:hypothetical protein